MQEIWKDIEGFEGLYQVSNLGRVKSVRRVIMRRNGQPQTVRERIRTLVPNKFGHLAVALYKDGAETPYLVHVLVLTAFHGKPPEGMECRHYPDRNPANNRIDNLRWGTRQENQLDRNIHGTSNSGERQWSSKLKAEDVRRIKELYETGLYTKKQIGKMYGVAQSHVSNITTGKAWRHLLLQDSA